MLIHSRKAVRGISLVEILVVLAIVGVLVGLSLPAVQSAREASRRASCSNNLHNVGLALDQHHVQLGAYPEDGENGYGMAVFLLPFLEQVNLYEQLNPRQVALPSPTQARPGLEGTVLPVLLCPSEVRDEHLASSDFARGSYLGNSELFSFKSTYEFIRDGESKTIAMGETASDHAWALPKTGSGTNPPNQGGAFGSYHNTGANFVFCDAAVKFITDDIDPDVFVALCTIDGNEPVGDF